MALWGLFQEAGLQAGRHQRQRLIPGRAAGLSLGLLLLAGVSGIHAQSLSGSTESALSSVSGSASGSASTGPVNSTKALNHAELSVVRILVVYRGANGAPMDQVGMGSGFVVAPGFIMTNYHVVETPPGATETEIYIVPHKDTGTTYQRVHLARTWTEGDMALLGAEGFRGEPLTLSQDPQKNQRVVAMGYPGVTDRLLKRGGTELLEPADAYVTQGSIALFATTNPDGSRVGTLFHTAPINLGNSGGPLLNECGQVVGINTWSAASSMSESGDVDVPAGQFVATHVAAIRDFLKGAGLKSNTATEACYAKSEADLVKDDALSQALSAAAAAQKQKLEESRKALDAQRLMNSVMLGVVIVLSVLVLFLIATILGRRHHKEPTAPTAFSADTSRDAPLAPPLPELRLRPRPAPAPRHIPWGWLMLMAGIIVIAVALIVSHGRIQKMLRLHPATPALQSGAPVSQVAHLICSLDSSASHNPLSGTGPLHFDFDSDAACVNGRTPYARIEGGRLERFTLADNRPARLELTADGTRFTRSDYQLPPAALEAFVAQKSALGTPNCAAPDHADQKAALAENLRKVRILAQTYLNRPADQVTTWTCRRDTAH